MGEDPPSTFNLFLQVSCLLLARKDGKEADKIKSYRPVTLLPTIGKVLEQILLRRLNHTLKKKNILHHNQFGFREGRSTDDAIHQLVEKIKDAKNKQLHTMVISLDIQGAFDLLQYNSIRNSLDEINFPSHTIETLKDILTDRKVTIQTAQDPVSWSQQQGCAQGSCIGPMFWNLVANEIISEEWQPNVHLQAFADDFIFVISEPTGAKLKATAQAALTKFQHWTDKHQLKVSTEKSTTILISRLVSGPRVKWDNQIIKRSTSLKYLGVIIDNKLNWADHLINMKTKLTHLHQKITRIAGTNWELNKDLRRRLYKTVAERMILHCSMGLSTISQTIQAFEFNSEKVSAQHHRGIFHYSNSRTTGYRRDLTAPHQSRTGSGLRQNSQTAQNI
ncbi:Retrovirus-related Pol polyprotein from type-1 retrotransposable element R1 [Araneus ventricosus]|uniref:Retrovirus-related Pol polyprotein from type-1 retrotransposable element R1 n=1 Tax=Araneus ventricosus TaxID=182803 RepID=A0A4Y2WG95_ARAVE|nr:Retrovirus-related Pol polyprotein from type-1 retrotransposable element R1 [Araneus ventricosus]